MGVHRDAEFNKRPRARRSCAASSRRRGSRCTRSCAATSGTCCPRRSAARCSPTTAARAPSPAVHRQHRRARSRSATTSGSSPLEADELDRPRRPDARPPRDRCAPARARGGPVLHGPPHRARPSSRRCCVSDRHRGPTAAHRRAPRRRPRRDAARIRRRARRDPGRVRRHPARRLRRTRGPGRRHPVPAQRHARPRHPRRAPRGGRAPLPPLRRRQPDQRRRTAQLKAALEAELAARGIDLPVLWGNRNWDPYLRDALAEADEPRVHAS